MFALIPSILAILQGVGDEQGCKETVVLNSKVLNSSVTIYLNETVKEPFELQPRFSVFTYFLIIFAFLLTSSIAFIMLNCLSFVRKEHKDKDTSNRDVLEKESFLIQDKENPTILTTNNKKEKIILYSINFMNTFLSYGILAGLQSYSALPYGLYNSFTIKCKFSN